jgi:hypothetical protein
MNDLRYQTMIGPGILTTSRKAHLKSRVLSDFDALFNVYRSTKERRLHARALGVLNGSFPLQFPR